MFEKLETLLKALKNQSILPSIKTTDSSIPKINSPQSKIPGVSQGSKKNPIKVAEQTQNKDIKDIKMKEAQQQFKINKSTGQWSLN